MTLDFEDLDAFFVPDEFASQVLIGPSGSEVAINAIFDAAYLAVDETMSIVSTNQPQITCKSSDVASVTQNERVVVNGQAYRVSDIQPDGTGITILTLHKTP